MNFNKEKFASILMQIKDSYGSINKMANKTHVTAAYISKLIRLQYDSPPSPEILRKISDNSNFVTDYSNLMRICGYFDSKENNYRNIKDFDFNFNFVLYNKLNDTGQRKVNEYMKDLIDTNNYNKKNK